MKIRLDIIKTGGAIGFIEPAETINSGIFRAAETGQNTGLLRFG